MRVTRYLGEKSVETLARKLYSLDDPGADVSKAVDALVEANPNLPLRQPGPLSKAIDKDTLITVPDVEGATVTDAAQPVDAVANEGLLARTKEAIDLLQPELDAENDRAAADLKETIELISSQEFLEAAKRDPNLAATLKGVSENARLGLEEVSSDAADQRSAIEGAQSAIQGLLELAKLGTGRG
jgi:hypothetical protein